MATLEQDSNTFHVENKKHQDDEGQAAAEFVVVGSSGNPIFELPSFFDDVAFSIPPFTAPPFAENILENMYMTQDDKEQLVYYVIDPDEIDSSESDSEYDADTSSSSEDFSEELFYNLSRPLDLDDDDDEKYSESEIVDLPFENIIGNQTDVEEEFDEEENRDEEEREVLRSIFQIILEEQVKETMQALLDSAKLNNGYLNFYEF